MSQEIISLVEQKNLKTDVPEFDVGDTGAVHTKILAGEKERTQILDAIHVPYRVGSRVGSPATEILQQVRDTECDAIIMGTRGMGSLANLVIGSVTTKVIHLVEVPVTLIK